jgi:putative transposase
MVQDCPLPAAARAGRDVARARLEVALMPRRLQVGSGGIVFHVLNRGVRRATLFDGPRDYAAFLDVLCESENVAPMRLLCFAVMPNHWHLVVWPTRDPDLSHYMQWVTRTHAQRWHLARNSVGTGAVYQGRYRAIPVQEDLHFLTVCRYVERNPLRARLVDRAEAWRWSSAWTGPDPTRRPSLSEWPVPRPPNWSAWINETWTESRLDRLRECINRQQPFGSEVWSREAAVRLDMTAACRGRGRPLRARVAEAAHAFAPIDGR